MPARSHTALRRHLLAWFDRSQRSLPWRADRDPYRIWVSEIMLQQTQVASVIPYFDRFLAAFPTVTALASAAESAVLRHWEGLGYYRRARDLHAAARMIVRDHAGRLPDDPAVWAELPGVGRYVLGAVLSQAFERRLPIVEANSQRVLCRLFGQHGELTSGPVRKWLWQTAEAILPRRRIGAFNQALMELGALVCTPKQPRCGECPLARQCVARREGIQEQLPVKAARALPEQVEEVAAVPTDGSRVLLLQRPAVGRWANLWEFPHGVRRPDETAEIAAGRVLAEQTGLSGSVGPTVTTIRHGITRYRIRMVCLRMVCAGPPTLAIHQANRWLEPSALATLPLSRPQRLLANALAQPQPGSLFADE